jgi:hypothetical protein
LKLPSARDTTSERSFCFGARSAQGGVRGVRGFCDFRGVRPVAHLDQNMVAGAIALGEEDMALLKI